MRLPAGEGAAIAAGARGAKLYLRTVRRSGMERGA
jgi:hypothetical protein